MNSAFSDLPAQTQGPMPTTGGVTGSGKRSALVLIGGLLVAPYRAFRRVCRLYERGMVRCAGSRAANMAGGFYTMGGSYSTFNTLSFSVRSSSSEDDHRELIRVASQRPVAAGIGSVEAGLDGSRRNYGAVLWTIDEDQKGKFGDTDAGSLGKLSYPRTKSMQDNRSHKRPLRDVDRLKLAVVKQ